ncbi:MAG: TetR/AcrR family transcriptional regulator [Pseudomonadota bacterium]
MDTKAKLAAVAQRLFVRQGVDRTPTSQICKEASLSSGSLFVHFKTKQDLIDAIYLDRKKAALDTFQRSVSVGAPAEQNVKAVSRTVVEYYLTQHEDFQFFRMLELAPAVSQKAIDAQNNELAWILSQIESWSASKALKPFPAEFLLQIWWSILSALVVQLHAAERERVLDGELTMVWDALKR